MHSFTRVQKLVFCILIAILIAPTAWPQAGNGSVSGTVRDQTGAVIPKASVMLTGTATNMASKTTANEVGFYLYPVVTPGPYMLTVEVSGMQKFEGSLTVLTGQSAVVDVAMKVGQTATEVQVHDVTPMLTVDSPTLSSTLERTRIEQLPIDGRQLTNLLITVPGMEGGKNSRAFGLRLGSFEASLDGAAMEDRYQYGSTANLTYVQPGLDSIQEFKVETNSSSAKYTRPTSIIMTTKGGTNELHGSAFLTNRNNGYGLARSRTDGNTAPPLNRNEFGVSSGGPVYIPKVYNGKNKTFWFFSYEALRLAQSSTQNYALPTTAMLNGDMRGLVDSGGNQTLVYNPWTTDPNTWARQQFSYNGQLNVIDPALKNGLAKLLMGTLQTPTTTDNPLVASNWYGPVSQPQRTWTTSARIDHRFSDKDQFYGRYTQGGYTRTLQYYFLPTTNFDLVPANTEHIVAPNRSLSLSYVHTFSPTFFNEFLGSVTRQHEFDATGDPTKDYATPLGLPNPFNGHAWPYLYGAASFGGLEWIGQQTNSYASVYGIVDDNATKIHGKHEFQFGFHYRWDQLNIEPDQQFVAGSHEWQTGFTSLYDPTTSPTAPQATSYTGETLANTYLGLAEYSAELCRNWVYGRQKEYSGYFQDNWRATSRLTLNLGLRYEYWSPFSEKNNVLIGFDSPNHALVLGTPLSTMYGLGATLPTIVNRYIQLGAKFENWQDAGMPNPQMMTSSKNDFGPRLGFAYRAGEGRKSFVVRGGYRISYFHLPAYQYWARMRRNAPLTAQFYQSFTQGDYSPDGIDNLGMRSVPTLIAGVNTQNAIPLDATLSLGRGSANISYFGQHQPDARVQDWNFTLEKEIMPNTVLRAAYIGNHSSNLEQFFQYNNTTPGYIWYMTYHIPTPTGSLSSTGTQPYDQGAYSRVEEWLTTGWGNSNGLSLELQRRYSKGYAYQVFYVLDNNMAAGGQGFSGTSVIPELNQFLPGQVPADFDARNRLLNYQRDTSVPKHRVRWNWIVDLPFGKGKPLLGNAGSLLNRLVGGWQVAGIGQLRSNYFSLPTNYFNFGQQAPVQIYGYKYPIQNCTSGNCYPGYLWWNGYIPAYQINSHDPVTGKPNGYEGIPASYQPAVVPLWPYPANYRSLSSKVDPLYNYYGGNTTWIPLNTGIVQRVGTWAGLPPLRQQYLPSNLTWGLDASAIKNVPIKERFTFRLQADFFNVLNHPGNPTGVSGTGILSTQNSGNSPRTIQLQGRLTW